MKISPIATGGMPGTNINTSPSPDRIAAAKAIAAGQEPQAPTSSGDPQVDKINIRRIKMKTNATVLRDVPQIDPQPVDNIEATGVKTDADVPANVVEETKPLSPQFAALAKQRRALQVQERALADREKALEQRVQEAQGDLIAKLKSQPLSVLQEHGVTYDQLTEAILSGSSGVNPEIQQLKAELKALKEGVDKNLLDRDTAAERQVLAEMQKEAVALAREGDAFELVREERRIPDVIRLIHQTYKSTGEVLDVSEAMQLVEDELLKDNLRRASFKKIQSKLTPPPMQQAQPQQKQMKTLTNRDTSTVPLSRKERALLAFSGQLKG